MRDKFPNVYAVDTVRHEDGEGDPQTFGPMGLGMPSFIDKDKFSALEGVMLDYLLLCRSDHMIHSFGSVSTTVLLTKPEMTSELVGKQYKTHKHLPKLIDDCSLEYQDGLVEIFPADNNLSSVLAEESIGKLCEISDGTKTKAQALKALNQQLPDDSRWDEAKFEDHLIMLVNKGIIELKDDWLFDEDSI
jgi:hypothetical protein